MSVFIKLLVVGAVAGFVLAVVSCYLGAIANISPEGFSRASTNLALIAIALSMMPGGAAKQRPTG